MLLLTATTPLISTALLRAQLPAASPDGPKRLLAYYLYQDQSRVPAYTASRIPYKKLTHLIHVALIIGPDGDGSIQISPHALEAKLIPKAHAAIAPHSSAAGF